MGVLRCIVRFTLRGCAADPLCSVGVRLSGVAPVTRRLLLAPRAALLALAASTLTVLPGLVGPSLLTGAGIAVAAAPGSLSVSPNRYVAGQAVRFRGNLGVSG